MVAIRRVVARSADDVVPAGAVVEVAGGAGGEDIAARG